jgi:hypothetical protein
MGDRSSIQHAARPDPGQIPAGTGHTVPNPAAMGGDGGGVTGAC